MSFSSIKELKSFDEYMKMISQQKPTIIDFRAPGPTSMIGDQMLRPFVAAAQFSNTINFCSVDILAHEDIRNHAQIDSSPSFALYIRGEQVDMFQGPLPDRIRNMVNMASGMAQQD